MKATAGMQLPKGDAATAKLHREWLAALPRLTGEPLTRIARNSSVSASTLTRPLKEGEDGSSTLHAHTIAKVVAHYGVAPPAGVAAPHQGSRPGARSGLVEEAAPYISQPKDPLAPAVAALTSNYDAVVAWALRTRALELAGFLPGDIVLVDMKGVAKPGDIVCAEVQDWNRGRTDTVMRVLERAAPVDLLVAKTLDPDLQSPIVVDGERVVIKGVLLPHRLRAS